MTEEINSTFDEATAERKITAMRNKEIEKLFFDGYVQRVKNAAIAKSNGSNLLDMFCKKN